MSANPALWRGRPKRQPAGSAPTPEGEGGAVSGHLFEGKSLLVIAPHADDEVAGCAGTMLRARQLGARTFLTVVSVGDIVRVGEGDQLATGHERLEELKAVTEFLGIEDHEVLYLDDHLHLRLDRLPRRDLAARLEHEGRLALRRLRPDIVLLPWPSYNQDHEAVTRAGMVACRPHDPAGTHVPSTVLLYEYPPNSWCLPSEAFRPSLYVDITQTLEGKLQAFGLYRSQARSGLHQNTPENFRDLARVRGKEAGVEAAEAFHVQRMLT